MKKLRCLSILVLIGLVTYFIADQTGMVDYVNDMVNQKNGWKQTDNGYVRSTMETIYRVNVTMLKDPKSSFFNLYGGAMKKSAVDRMELVAILIIEATDQNKLHEIISSEAKKLECNVAIINGMTTYRTAKTEQFTF